MPRITPYLFTSTGSNELATPENTQAEMKAFGGRIARLMAEKQWNQSDLADKAGLGRDSISTYIRGLVLPSPSSLRKIAAALEVEPSELISSGVAGSLAQRMTGAPILTIEAAADHPGMARIHILQTVTLKLATEIMSLLHATAPDSAPPASMPLPKISHQAPVIVKSGKPPAKKARK